MLKRRDHFTLRVMRLRSAQRIARFKTYHGYYKYNPFVVIQALVVYYLKYDSSDKKYKLNFTSGSKSYYRENYNPLKLFEDVAEYLLADVLYFQGRMSSSKGDPELGKYIGRELRELHGNKLDIFLPFTPPLMPRSLYRRPDDSFLQPIIDEWVAEENIDATTYCSSNEIEDPRLKTEALTMAFKIPKREEREEDIDDICKMLIDMWARRPYEHEVVPKMTKEALYDIATKKTSSGPLNLDETQGLAEGSKELCVDGAVKCAMETYCALNDAAQPKLEVVKKGKKLRYILSASQSNIIKTFFFFGRLIKEKGRVIDHDCVGLSKVHGSFNKVIYSMYLDHCAVSPISWDDFLELLQGEGFDEDDKKQWEYTVGINPKYAYIMWLSSRVTPHHSDKEHLASVLAQVMGPIIKYDGHKAYFTTMIISGGPFTIDLNGFGHDAGNGLVVNNIQEHGMKMGDKDCRCNKCEHSRDNVYFGDEVDLLDLVKISGGAIVGDDRFRRACKGEYVMQMIDYILDTITEGQTKPFAEAEFLRTRFKITDGRLTHYRDSNRVFNKFIHGQAKYDAANALSAITSMSMELGDNEPAIQAVHRLYDKMVKHGFDGENFEASEDNLYRGVLKGDLLRPFTYQEVLIKIHDNGRSYLEARKAWHIAVNYGR